MLQLKNPLDSNEPAPRASFVALLFMFLSIGLALALGNLPLRLLFDSLNREGRLLELEITHRTGSLSVLELPIGLEFFFIFFPFIPVLAALILGYPLWFRRSAMGLVGPQRSFRWKLALRSGSIWLGLALAMDSIAFATSPGDYQWNFDLLTWIKMNAWLLVFIPLQTAAEEGFFRGLLLDQIGAWRGRAPLAILVSSMLFTLLHGPNPEVREYGVWLMIPQYLGMALFFSYVTYKDKGWEGAWGIHLANNWYGISLVNLEHSVVPSASMWVVKNYQPLKGALFLFLSMGIYLWIQSRREKVQPHQS